MPPSTRKRALRSAAITVLAAAVISRLLAVNLIPVITNDSVGYLSQAQDLFSDGLVRGGYRQVGYPLFLASTDIVGTVLRLEPVLMTAAIQRLLLSIGIAYSVWLFRWWAIPVVVVATAPDIVAYTNLILTEALMVPLAIIYATSLAHVVMTRSPRVFPGASVLPTCSSRGKNLPI